MSGALLRASTRGVRFLLVAVIGCVCLSCSQPAPPFKFREVPKNVILGIGATLPGPLYEKWIREYQKINPKAAIRYEALGSGEGVSRFIDHYVDFGASDAAMSDEEIAQAKDDVQLIPVAAGSIALAYHLPDLSDGLRMSRSVYLDIFFGKIRQWDDPRIQADNPDLKLPSLPIKLIARRDHSGTTFAFTNHLSAISEDWRDRGPGAGLIVQWPEAATLAVGNEGVAEAVKTVPGSIGYMDFGVAKRAALPMAALENKAGSFVPAGGSTGLATLIATPLPQNLRAFFPDPDGSDSYPIVTYTWLLLYRQYDVAEKRDSLKAFVEWCLTDGQQYNEQLGYIRLPPDVARRSVEALAEIR